MWRPTELKVAESKGNEPKPVAVAAPAKPPISTGMATEQATLGSTMTVKGELSGSQALYVDGRVEGSIRFPEHRVTIGRSGVVLANIAAKEVVIMGNVTGNIECGDRVDIRGDAVLTGDVVTRRISIDEGALVKGSVEVCRGRVRNQFEIAEPGVKVEEQSKAEGPAASAAPADAAKAAAAAGTRSALRVAGSSVLFEENKGGR